MWIIFQLSSIFLITHLAKIKDQALHTHPYNLHFLKGYLKELCIHLNGGRQSAWLESRYTKGYVLCPWPLHTARFFQSLSLDCQSEINMLQAVRDQSIEHQIVLCGFSYLSVPWSPSIYSLSWMDNFHLRHVPHSSHSSRWGGLPCVTASDSS